MCGICGIYHTSGKPAGQDTIRKMTDTLIHRGPDGYGSFVMDNLALGHRRLSIIDLSGGSQPMGTRDRSVQVTFNGEIYNYQDLRGELMGLGYEFDTKSDTETILYGYKAWGNGVFERLRGMFAIGLWDVKNRTLILARDRLGKKPLYYYHHKGLFLFASELKAIQAYPGLTLSLDYDSLDTYLSFGYVPAPGSIYREIKKLMPAHMAVLSGGKLTTKRYWRLSMHQPPIGEDEAAEKLTRIFDESVRLRMISDVPLGAFLSGGVDSSAVVAAMALQSHKKVKTASIGFSEKKFNELSYASQVAEMYQTDHNSFVVTPKALDILDKIVWHFDEPFADASAIPTWYVSQQARKKVTVALSGDGGDETFAGYIDRYSMNRLENRIREILPENIRTKLVAPLGNIYPRVDSLPRILRLKRFLQNIARTADKAYLRDMSFYFTPEDKTGLYRPETAGAVNSGAAGNYLSGYFNENKSRDIVTKIQYVDIHSYLPEDILVKVDRMSMAHSLEVRSPLLDHKLMEFAGMLPSSLKLRGGKSKYIFKKINEKRLSHEILHRRKQGFRVPLAEWLRGSLKNFCRDTLFSSENRLMELLETERVKLLWSEHQSGKYDNSAQIWGLVMLELWMKKFRM